MISDQHYTVEPDVHGIELTEKLIAIEKPDVVVAAGDCLTGKRIFIAADVEKAIANVGAAMEKMRVPWAITFGNHDQELLPKPHLGTDQVLKFCASYPHNINAGWVRGIHGAENKNILIWNAAASKPVFSLWLVASGDEIRLREDRYDWIHTDQVHWYHETSKQLENKYGGKIPGLMLFHIPLPEFHDMIESKKIVGERHEPEAPSVVNGGLFAAVLNRGDVKGIFCGHDHVNNYVGLWRGVTLGFDGVVGHRGYPKSPPDHASNNRARGGRVFLITESDPWQFKTWMRFKDGSTNWESQAGIPLHEQLK